MTTITGTTTTQTVTVLKHLINGRDDDFITAATRLTNGQIADIKASTGYPDVDKMEHALGVLMKRQDDQDRANIITQAIASSSAAARTTTPRPQPPKPAPQRIVRDVDTERRDLLAAADKSPKHRTRQAAAKIRALLADLEHRLEQEAAEEQARKDVAKAKAKRDARIAELEAELRKLKNAGRKTKAAPVPRSDRLSRGVHPCEQCDRVFDTAQGVTAHRRRTHEGFNPHAAKEGAA